MPVHRGRVRGWAACVGGPRLPLGRQVLEEAYFARSQNAVSARDAVASHLGQPGLG